MKPYTLTNRDGETISPMTSTRTVFDECGVDLDTLLEQHRQDADNALKDYAKKTEVTQSLAGKQNKLTPTTDLHITEDNIIGLTEEFKDSKLDKAVWEERTKSFYIIGIISPKTGSIAPSASAWRATEFLPLNRNNPLIVDLRTNSEDDQCGGIFFYDQNKIFLKHICTPTHIQTEIDPSEIPSKAVYFRCNGVSSYPNNYINGLTFEAREGAVSEAIAASKFALFIDQWNAACGSFGRYNPETGYFELNGLTDITYEEAVITYLWGNKLIEKGFSAVATPNTKRIRTNLPPINTNEQIFMDLSYLFKFQGKMEVCRLIGSDLPWVHLIHTTNTWLTGSFDGCTKLRVVLGVINLEYYTAGENIFRGCISLEDIQILRLKANLNMSLCPKLSVGTMSYLVTNAANTSSITITVHPNVYAKLTGDTTNPTASALTEEELAQWQQLLVDAAEKQINFATT